jgi:hypothetical protein
LVRKPRDNELVFQLSSLENKLHKSDTILFIFMDSERGRNSERIQQEWLQCPRWLWPWLEAYEWLRITQLCVEYQEQ